MQKMVEATVLTRKASGKNVFILLIPNFATSINESKGQILEAVGIHLAESFLSHGQLYVGCSRVRNPPKIFIYAPKSQTENIMYHEVL